MARLILAAVADEEALGSHGAGWLTEHAASAVEADYVITEEGASPSRRPAVGGSRSWWARREAVGAAFGSGDGRPRLGTFAYRQRARHGGRGRRAPGRFRPTARVHDAWRRFVGGMALPDEIGAMFCDPARIDDICESFPHVGLARQAHACTHMTIAPTIVHGGTKLNVIPDQVELDLDVRTLPGQSEDDVRSLLAEAIGDLGDKVEIVWADNDPASESPVGTPLWDELDAMVKRFHPGAESVPYFSGCHRRRGSSGAAGRSRTASGCSRTGSVSTSSCRCSTRRRARRRRVARPFRRDVRGSAPFVPDLSRVLGLEALVLLVVVVVVGVKPGGKSIHNVLHTAAGALDDFRETLPVVLEGGVKLGRGGGS